MKLKLITWLNRNIQIGGIDVSKKNRQSKKKWRKWRKWLQNREGSEAPCRSLMGFTKMGFTKMILNC